MTRGARSTVPRDLLDRSVRHLYIGGGPSSGRVAPCSTCGGRSIESDAVVEAIDFVDMSARRTGTARNVARLTKMAHLISTQGSQRIRVDQESAMRRLAAIAAVCSRWRSHCATEGGADAPAGSAQYPAAWSGTWAPTDRRAPRPRRKALRQAHRQHRADGRRLGSRVRRRLRQALQVHDQDGGEALGRRRDVMLKGSVDLGPEERRRLRLDRPGGQR